MEHLLVLLHLPPECLFDSFLLLCSVLVVFDDPLLSLDFEIQIFVLPAQILLRSYILPFIVVNLLPQL